MDPYSINGGLRDSEGKEPRNFLRQPEEVGKRLPLREGSLNVNFIVNEVTGNEMILG